MSIHDAIKECVDGGELVRLQPLLPGDSVARPVLVSHDVLRLVERRDGLPIDLVRKSASARSMLDSFQRGDRVTVGMDPHNKPGYCMLARTDPTKMCIWQFRILDPKPHVRIFGAFAEQDVFVALAYYAKPRLNFLGSYRKVTKNAREIWTTLFGDCEPCAGDNVDEYLSENYILV